MSAQHKRPGYTARNERRASALDRLEKGSPVYKSTLSNMEQPPARGWRAARRRKGMS